MRSPAAATIASGSRTAIDADIFNKAAIADFAAAIQRTCTTDILNYTDKLPILTDSTQSPLIVSNEIAKIQSYHAECGLAPAESAIQAKLGTPPTPQTPPPPAGGEEGNQVIRLDTGASLCRQPPTGPLRAFNHLRATPTTRAAIVGRGSW